MFTYQGKLKCNKCNEQMYLEDVDYNFKGNQDEYWQCNNCGNSCFIKVRYGKVCKIKFDFGNNC